jgi:hypothetical protein
MRKAYKLAIVGIAAIATAVRGEDCGNFNGEMSCKSGSQTTYPDDWA